MAVMENGWANLALSYEETGAALSVYPHSTVYGFGVPAPGYKLDQIIWSLSDGSASYDITTTATFVMPAMAVVVYVTFKPAG